MGVSNNKEYLKIFNNFRAWHLWPAEKDIVDMDRHNEFKEIWTITRESLKLSDKLKSIPSVKNFKDLLDNNEEKLLAKEAWEFADNVVNFLKSRNKELINLLAFSLVDITHKWDCWDITRKIRKSIIKRKIKDNNIKTFDNIDKIPSSSIVWEIGYFS